MRYQLAQANVAYALAPADDPRLADYVARLDSPGVNRAHAFDAATGDIRAVDFGLQRDGQRLNVNVVFIGRGTFEGRLLDEEGAPLAGGNIRITSLTDLSQQFGATSDAAGRFTDHTFGSYRRSIYRAYDIARSANSDPELPSERRTIGTCRRA